MRQTTFSLGTFFGIELRTNLPWLIVMFMLVWYLGAGYYRAVYPDWIPGARYSAALATGMLFFVSFVLHELGHALTSIKLGKPTSSLNLSYIGSLEVIDNDPSRPRDEFLIAVAGPLLSILLAVVFTLIAWAGSNKVGIPLAAFSRWLGMANLGLAAFHLLPGLPLDGGRIVHSIVWALKRDANKGTAFAGLSGRVVAFVFVLSGAILFFGGLLLDGFLLAMAGLYLNHKTTESIGREVVRQTLAGHTAREAMVTDFPQVGPAVTLQELETEWVLDASPSCLLIAAGSRIIGFMPIDLIYSVPRADWSKVTVGRIMISISDLNAVSPNEDLFNVLNELMRSHLNRLPVVEKGIFLGVIGIDNISTFMESQVKV